MGHYDAARERAKRRKSPWNLLLIPTVFGSLAFLWWYSLVALVTFHKAFSPDTVAHGRPTFAGVVSLIALIIGLLPVAMIIGNWLVRAIPPARRSLDAEAVGYRGTDYRSAQLQLLRLSYRLVPLMASAAALAALFPWQR